MRIKIRKSFKISMVVAALMCGIMGLLWFTLIHKPFTYTDNGTSITITRWADAVGAVEIPSTVYGKPVTCIGTEAFARCTEVDGGVIIFV